MQPGAENYGGRESHFAIDCSVQPIRVTHIAFVQSMAYLHIAYRISPSRGPLRICVSYMVLARPIAYSHIAFAQPITYWHITWADNGLVPRLCFDRPYPMDRAMIMICDMQYVMGRANAICDANTLRAARMRYAICEYAMGRVNTICDTRVL